MTESPSPPAREDAILRAVLPIAAAAALVLLAAATWLYVHPVAGGIVAAAGFGGWWVIVTRREHERARSREHAEILARNRSPFPAPPSPSGGSPSGRRSPFDSI